MHVMLDLGFDTHVHATLRLYGVNTPEMSTHDGPMAKAFTEDWLMNQSPAPTTPDETIALKKGQVQIKIRTIKDKKEKYGRYLAVIWPHDSTMTLADVTSVGSLNSNLIMQGWAYGVKS